MKNLITIIAGVMALVAVSVVSAWAFPITTGSTITMYAGDTAEQYEGHYQAAVVNPTTGAINRLGVFCLERNEFFTHGSKYTVTSVSDSAESGGVAGATNGKDPISNATKWLYTHFMQRDIKSVTGYEENDFALQLAFWYLEDEITVAFNDYAKNIVAQAYVDKAIKAALAGEFTSDVRVMNIINAKTGEYAQSQLVGAPVPEPSTLLLLGAGLAGVGFARRRSPKK